MFFIARAAAPMFPGCVVPTSMIRIVMVWYSTAPLRDVALFKNDGIDQCMHC